MSAFPRDPRVAAAVRAAKKTSIIPRVRFEEDGSAELLTVRRGRAQRDRIDATGHVERLETGERQRGWIAGRSIVVVGLVAFAAPFVLGIVGWSGGGSATALLVGGMVLSWIGWWIEQRHARDSMRRVESEDDWFELKALVRLDPEKLPLSWLSLPQLCAVEELASGTQNVAAVRLDPAGEGVEVVTKDRRTLARHRVGQDGNVALVDSATYRSRASARPWNRYGGTKQDWMLIDLNDRGD